VARHASFLLTPCNVSTASAYTQASLENGSNIEEMTEAVHVACAIRGGASLIHGVQMHNVTEKLSM